MNRTPTMFDNIRNILLLVLVVFVSLIFGGLIYGSIIALLYYLFQRYYKRSKQLEKQLADLGGKAQTETDAHAPTPSSVPPPPPTDA